MISQLTCTRIGMPLIRNRVAAPAFGPISGLGMKGVPHARRTGIEVHSASMLPRVTDSVKSGEDARERIITRPRRVSPSTRPHAGLRLEAALAYHRGDARPDHRERQHHHR